MQNLSFKLNSLKFDPDKMTKAIFEWILGFYDARGLGEFLPRYVVMEKL